MPCFVLSAFYRRALAIAGCALAITLHATPLGRHSLPGHIPKIVPQLKPLSALAETNRLRLALALPLRHQPELAALLRDLYDPSSARFHQFLKPSEFAACFGPTEEDYAKVSAFARAHGLHVTQTHPNRLLLDVEGSVADVNASFHIKMKVFQHPTENRTFYAPEVEPSMEATLPLQHVSGLDNYFLPKSNLKLYAKSNPANAQSGSGPNGAFMGHDFRAAYAPGVTLDGAGQTLALVEFDTFFDSDITAYESMAGLPNVPVTTVPIDGFSGPPGGGEDEVSLDIELAISMAPGLSQVVVYEAPFGFTSANDDLLNQIAEDDLANQIACCWVFTIDSTTDLIFQEMAAQGQSFFIASGDSGAYYTDPVPVETDPNITVVGGTTLTTSGPGGPWASETVWNWFSIAGQTPAGSSGGISSTYAIPYWQQAVNTASNQGSALWRNIPDVALTGDNIVLISEDGQLLFGGGTSCAAPLWAGLTALINQQAAQNGLPSVGFLNPAIYAAAQSALYPTLFHDITTGNNTNFNGSTEFFAGPGFDLCTGWGTPNGQALINALAPPDSLSLQPGGGAYIAVTNGVLLAQATQILALKNTEDTTVDWALGGPNWLSVSAIHGVIPHGQQIFLLLEPTAAAANLPPGSYVTNLLITNLTDGVTHLFPVFLQVSDPLIISPNSGMAVVGPPGGPFNETAQNYSLSNAATVPINWTARNTTAFADFFPASGTLPPGSSTNIVSTLNPSASNVLISAQAGNLLFTDLTKTNTQSQPFTLTVGNGGFETGDFSDWILGGPGNAADFNFVGEVLFFADYIHSGAYAAILGEPTNEASLSQPLPTVPGQVYQISFFLNNPVGGPPNEFQVIWNGTTLFNQVNVPQMQWTNMQFTVLATNAATTLQFLFRNDPDAFGLDDISVTSMAPPTFSSITFSNGVIYFSWNTIPGGLYQLQFSTDLFSWVNSGPQFTATNGVMATNEIVAPTNPQQYYRLYLLAN